MDSAADEAAALFGVTDAPDPFALALGGESSQSSTTETAQNATHAEHAQLEQSPEAADLFGTSDNTDFLGAATTMSSGASDAYGGYNQWDIAVAQQDHNVNASAPAATDYVQQEQMSRWYSQYGQGTAYARYSAQTPAYATQSTNQYRNISANGTYGTQYAPTYGAVSTSPPPPVNPPAAPVHNVASTIYDPYKPSTQTAPNPYAPSQPAASHEPYDPYKPVKTEASIRKTLEPRQPYVNGSSSVRSGLSVTAVPPTAAVPTAPASPYRPKTSNAYDPPIPPPKPSRQSSRQMYSTMPTIGQQLNGSPQSPPPSSRKVSAKSTPTYTAVEHSVQGSASTTSCPDHAGAGPSHYGHHAPANGTAYGAQPTSSYTAGMISGTYAPEQSHGSPGGSTVTYNGGTHAVSPHNTESPSLPSVETAYTSAASLHDDQSWPGLDPEAEIGSSHLTSNDDVHAGTLATHFNHPVLSTTTISSNEHHGNTLPVQGHSTHSPGRAQSLWESVAPVTHSADAHSNAHQYDDVSPIHSLPERTKSPGSSSVRSWTSTHKQDQIHASPLSSPPQAAILPPNVRVHKSEPNPYEPRPFIDAKRAASPSAMSIKSTVSSTVHDPYAPSKDRSRSMSNGSALSITGVVEDPYVPSRHVRQQRSDASSRGSVSSLFDRPPISGAATARPAAFDGYGGVQVLSVPHPTQTMYAPSPSLLGANDPLGRTSVRVPVISFGSGGKFVTCFHGASDLNTGFDVALSSRQSTDIKIQLLHKVIPESALDTSAAAYPGPLFADPGSPSTSLVRTGTATQTKTKKARVVKYLEERTEEIFRGLGYFHQSNSDVQRAEAKHTLVKILKIMVENDGRLSGSPQIDSAVRIALVPRLSDAPPELLRTASSLSVPDALSPGLPSTPFAGLTPALSVNTSDQSVASHTLRSSHLDKIQDFLLRGDKRAACHYASDEKLWAHAMVIASSIDKDMWKEVVSEFVRTEMAKATLSGPSDGREALRVAYNLFAGQGPASVRELAPRKSLLQSTLSSQSLQVMPPSMPSTTPLSATFAAPVEPVLDIPADVLAKWAETAAMIFTSPLTLEISNTLTALGDQLAANHWYEAAHVCYLLSPQTSPIGGIGGGSRIVLLGSASPSVSNVFAKDPDPIIFTEIAEFALSLQTPAKGQEAFAGLPHLQPYRLLRAAALAEMGHVQLANRYCEAISSSLGRNSPFINPTFVEQLKGLSDRLIAAPQLDKSGSWIGSKVPKPSLDGIGNWLEGRFTKFIAGDVDSPRPHEGAQFRQQQAASGPFAHYSTISSVESSAAPSPHQSRLDLTEMSSSPPPPPPFRTGSAMAMRSSGGSDVVPINRSSSAMDYVRPLNRKASPIPRVSSASATTTAFSGTSLYSQALNGHAFRNGSKQNIYSMNGDGNQSVINESADEEPNGPAIATWWGSSNMDSATPTASSFSHVDSHEAAGSGSGFISLMDDPAYSATPVAHTHSSSSRYEAMDDDDDLGLGNSSSWKKQSPSQHQETSNGASPVEEQAKKLKSAQPAEEPESKTTQSGSWLSRLWKRESTPAPIKANLGEQTSFYYDKELKRWVNKNTSSTPEASTPPPPPPRAQTASPGRSMASMPTGTTPPPPPARPATANAFDGPPPKPAMRIRSNLVPPEHENGSAPPTPLTAPPVPGGGPPPPGGRARTQAKKAVRNRYVDVFQQPGAA